MSADPPNDASATQRALDTTEILEHILLEIGDVKTLLLSQRVSKPFKAAIDGSIKLQRALFFQHDAALDCEPGKAQHRNGEELNPLFFGKDMLKLGDLHYKIHSGGIFIKWHFDPKNKSQPATSQSWQRMLVKHGKFDHLRLGYSMSTDDARCACFSTGRGVPQAMVLGRYEQMAIQEFERMVRTSPYVREMCKWDQ